MINSQVKTLYDKLKLRYSDSSSDSQGKQILRRIERSLNMLYPYEFIHDSKGVPNYNLKSIVLDIYSYELNVVRKYKRAEHLRDKISNFRQNHMWIRDDEEKCYKAVNPETGDVFVGYTFEEQDFVKRWIPEGEAIKDKSRFLFNECYRICNSEVARRKRLRKRVESIMASGNTYFITLTFSNDTLNSTKPEIRRIYVARFLSTISDNYVGNIDFGKLNGREHYHAVLSSDKLNDMKYTYDNRYGWICKEASQFDEWSKRGFYSIKSCGTSDTDKKKLASYTGKLVNHAIKETTKRNALIYSR